MPASLATVSGILKEIYEPPLRKQLNEETTTIKRLKRTSKGVSETTGGKYVTFPVHYQRNSGVGARRENESLPTPGNQGTAAAQVGLKYLYGSIKVSGQLFEIVDKDYQAFISAVDLEIEGLKRDVLKDLNRQVFGNGTGALATTSSSGAVSTLVITSGVQNLQIGEFVDYFLPATLTADGAAKGSTTITNITDNGDGTGSVTVSPATVAGLASGDVLVRNGNANREWTGLGAIVTNTGALYNIDPANVGVWKATVDDPGSTRPLAENQIIKNVDAVRTFGGETSLLVASLGVRRAYWNLLVQQRQFVNTKEFTGGFTGLGFTTDQREVPFIADIDAPKSTLYGLDESTLKIYQTGDWSFMDRDGSMWDRVQGFDSYMATLYQYSQMGCDRRNANFVQKNITEA